jgi:hypothetical protein
MDFRSNVMIRYINCVKRRSDVSIDEFRRHWGASEFDQLIKKTAELVGASGFKKSFTLQVPENEIIQLMRGSDDPFDGTIEYFLPNAHGFEKAYATDDFRDVSAKMTEYQKKFINISASSGFFTTE